MASRHKLSNNGQQLIEAAIQQRQWTNKELSEAATKIATREMLRLHRRYINQRGLNYYKVEEFVENGLLAQGSSTKICKEYSLFNLGKINLTWQQVEELVDKGIIQVKGYSISTCQGFRTGDNIEIKPFKTLCETLGFKYESVVYLSNRVGEMVAENQKKENLKLALGEFDHIDQCSFFEEKWNENQKLISLYIKNNSLQISRANLNLLTVYFCVTLERKSRKFLYHWK